MENKENQIIHKFTINAQLPSLNEVINANRGNRYKGSKQKKEIEELIGYEILFAKTRGTLKPVRNYPVKIKIDWHEATERRDLDNIVSAKKFILDALVKNGILKDDGQKFVKRITDNPILGKKIPNSYVVVYIFETIQ